MDHSNRTRNQMDQNNKKIYESFNDIHQKSKEYLKQLIIKWDLNIWKKKLKL